MEKMEHNIREEEAGARIDKVIAGLNEEWSRTQVQDWVKEGHVEVNGRSVKPNYKCQSGDKLVITMPEPEPLDVEAEEMNLDIDGSIKNLKKSQPKLALFGASVFLFPHPVKEISEAAKDIGAKVMYDGAHVAGLIGSGYFQQPLEEGADVFTLSTHKTFPGPQHGAVLASEDEELNKSLRLAAFPALLSNHHLHNVAGLAVALTEMVKFGKEYHAQVIKNAKALAQALHERGFEVLAEKKGFTESHTVVADISKLSKTIGWGDKIEEILEKARIILNRNLIPRDIKEKRSFRTPSGIRLGTSEVTRLGMKESEMNYIAELIERVCIKQQDNESVKQLVKEFRKDFQEVKYCFKSKTKAYQYINIH